MKKRKRNPNVVRVNGRVIGELLPEERLFKKTVLESKHLFQTFDAWGIDSDFFTDVLEPQDYTIEVFDVENKALYTVEAEKFKKHGRYFHFKNEKEDHKAQIFLSRRFFDKRLVQPATPEV
ncbi:MAG TPA: hypothetical protein ENI13_01465 [candidate division CPR3 bacterium]|uniref:Uncharacterized protein n=1 Tax=candidate division CPR3 bacterium TaxID=2268181 RepID=A0A7C1NPP9_UNCC3|nr:hypothetical protein [candidate division CPR3 bacterium]